MIEWLLTLLFPLRVIPAPDGSDYIRRWFVWPIRRQGWVRADRPMWVIHKICRSDTDRDPHTHPGRFHTLILRGGYTEFVYWIHEHYGRLLSQKRAVTPGMCLENPHDHIHRVELLRGEPCWTLVKMFPSRGQWGFVRPSGQVIDVDTYRELELARA